MNSHAQAFRLPAPGIGAAVCTVLACAGLPGAEFSKISVHPPEVRLESMRDRQGIVVQALRTDGITVDITAEASLSLENPAPARLEGAGVLPVADGETKLLVSHGDKTASLQVSVRDAAKDRPVSFKLDVMPVLTKAGCNTGTCHGSARGKDGFRLSLFGFDPEGDYHRLTREIPGRRINVAVPAESLVIEKATGKAPHTGGKRFEEASAECVAILRWLEGGAATDPGDLPHIASVELYPSESVLEGKGATQRLLLRAVYSDGSDRDVTNLAWYLSNNETVAAVSPEGVITAGERGEAFIMARFESLTLRTGVIVVPAGAGDPPAATADAGSARDIDSLIEAKLRKLRMTPSPVCGDETFLRRATIDIVGLLPTIGEYRRFLARTEPNKRELLVDELLARKEFVELWVLKFAELLQIRSTDRVSPKGALLFYKWLEERLASNTPMDQLVRELLGATGGTFGSPATNYYQNESDPLKLAENVAQVTLGMRIQCAQCHNHPFDRWTQNDYYGFAAFFARIGRKGGEDPRETILFDRGEGEVTHPVGGRVLQPKFLGGAEPETAGRDRRVVLAEWLASPENPWFAANLANVVWAHFFGRGIVHPVDDIRISNPPSNEELLAELGRRFTEYRYDFKRLVREICLSKAYQRVTATNESNRLDDRNFSHAAVRRMRAEVLNDCLSQVTESPEKLPGLPQGSRAVEIADGSASTYFLRTFGRATRETPCSCEVKMEPTLSQALHLMNGEAVARRIASGNLVGRRLEEKKAPREILEELALRVLCRLPTSEEAAALELELAADPDPKKVLEDLFWAILNSHEFVFNH